MDDLVFQNAQIIDGTSAPAYQGHIGVSGNTIETVSRDEPPTGEEVIDLDGAVLAPGFIDAHTHSDFELFSDPYLVPKLHQGVTTEILGQDGLGAAPVPADDTKKWADRMQMMTGSADDVGMWETVGDYLDAVEDANPALNMGMLVGHGTIRYNVMGMSERNPTEDELEQMQKVLQQALDDGCLGLSTGLIYHPQIHSETEELVALCETLSTTNRPFVAHIRSEGYWLFRALFEFISVGYETDVPLHLSHFKISGSKQHGKADLALAFLEIAREMGVEITADQYPYIAGSTALSSVLPPWLHAEGGDRTLELLNDPEARERIATDIETFRIPFWENDAGTVGWENILISDVGSEQNAGVEGKTITEIADERNCDPLDACLDLLIEENLNVRMIIFLMDESDVEKIFKSPLTCVGSDGAVSENPHPRLYGTYPKIIEEYVQKQNLVSLEEAVRKMTSLPAQIYGLQSKGLIREGMDADLVSFRPEAVSTSADYDNPKQLPTGIEHVIVNGTPVLKDSERTGHRPGQVVRP